MAMCRQFGLTYKDAAHQLFLMEVAAIDSHYDAMQALNAISLRIRTTVHNQITNPILTLDAMAPDKVNVQPGGTLNIDISKMMGTDDTDKM